MPRPQYPGKKRAFLNLTWPTGLLVAFSATAIPLITGIDFAHDKKDYAWMMYSVAAILVVAGVIQVWAEFSSDRAFSDIRDAVLEGCLQGMASGAIEIHRLVTNQNNVGLRAVAWAAEEGESFIQVTNYAGNHRAESSGKVGRRISSRIGCVGKAALTGEPHGGFRASGVALEHYVSMMVEQYRFTKPEANSLRADTYSWLAVPIVLSDRVPLLVIYFDSDDPGFFNQPEVATAVANICAAFISWAKHFYGV